MPKLSKWPNIAKSLSQSLDGMPFDLNCRGTFGLCSGDRWTCFIERYVPHCLNCLACSNV